jgi:hypothetical protein
METLKQNPGPPGWGFYQGFCTHSKFNKCTHIFPRETPDGLYYDDLVVDDGVNNTDTMKQNERLSVSYRVLRVNIT